jgi:hypothetical protein
MAPGRCLDPNPNLTVQLVRVPQGEWIGIRAQTRWQPVTGLGLGSGTLFDIRGEIGRVSMSVVLIPFPKAAAASKLATPTALGSILAAFSCETAQIAI